MTRLSKGLERVYNRLFVILPILFVTLVLIGMGSAMVYDYRAGVTPTPSQTPTPFPTSAKNEKILDADELTKLINQHRAKLGLPAFIEDETTCKFAKFRAQDVRNDKFPHEGFRSYVNKYKFTSVFSENNTGAFYTSNALDNWLASKKGHKEALEGTWKYACVACDDIDHVCVQIFTSYDNTNHTAVKGSNNVVNKKVVPTQAPPVQQPQRVQYVQPQVIIVPQVQVPPIQIPQTKYTHCSFFGNSMNCYEY